MGLDSSIRTMLRDNIAKSAFSLIKPNLKNAVIIDDVLTRLLHCRALSGNDTMTANDLFNVFMQPALELFNQSTNAVYIAICDNPLNVPIEKADIQVERAQAQQKRQTKQFDVSDFFHMDSNGRITPLKSFKSDELMMTRNARPILYRFFIQELKQQSIKEGCTFIFDFDAVNGPWVISWNRMKQVEELSHELGEADLAIVYWEIGQQEHCQPLWWRYMDRRKTKNSQQRNTEVYVNLKTLTDSVLDHFKTPIAFLMLCILCGNDFVKKSWIARMFNTDDIQFTLISCKFLSHKRNYVKEHDKRWIPVFIQHIFSTRFKNKAALFEYKPNTNLFTFESIYHFVQNQTAKNPSSSKPYQQPFTLPNREIRDLIHARVMFNVNYYFDSWKKYAGLTDRQVILNSFVRSQNKTFQ